MKSPLGINLEGFIMAERVGFEPTAPCGVTGFQDQLLKPLGHLSITVLLYQIDLIISNNVIRKEAII